MMLTTRILNLECYTPRWKSLQTPLPAPAGTADRSQWEVTMESQFLSGPLLYLLIAWGVATAVFLGLRSEEHTSELLSRGHLVCRLLLEKKNELLYYSD